MDTPEIVTGVSRHPLLDVAPDLADAVLASERELISRVTVVTWTVSGELDLEQLLVRAGAFATVIADGILIHRVALGDQPALRLLGPGDVVNRQGQRRTGLLTHSMHRTAGEVQLALLDDKVLLLAQRFPRLFVGLQLRLGEQHQRLAAQIAICQLPRVEDRVLAMLWLLAELWGRVTRSGTVLPVALTHDALGELIGARRSTVTLALKELTERGALFRQNGDWLLLEPPSLAGEPATLNFEPQVHNGGSAAWRDGTAAVAAAAERSPDQWSDLLKTLRQSHSRIAADVRSGLERSRMARERSESLRIAMTTVRRRPDPSAG